MKVLYILESFPPNIGGAEKFFSRIINQVSILGNHVEVLTTSDEFKNKQIIKGNTTIRYFNWIRISGHAIPNPFDLINPISNCDIVHCATYTSAIICGMLSKLFHKKFIVTVYEVLGQKWYDVEPNTIKAFIFMWIEKLAISFSFDKYHVISNSTSVNLIRSGIPKVKVVRIYPGIDDLNKSRNQKGKKYKFFTFLFYGRPGKTKGLINLIKAVKSIDNILNTNIKFNLILGPEPRSERENVINMINSLQLCDRIDVNDPVSAIELKNNIINANCIVVPSITEGFGFSAAEACVLNKPIIVSNAGSLPEVVFGKVLFFESNSITDLAAKLLLASENKFNYIKPKNFKWSTAGYEMVQTYKLLVK